MLDYLEILGIAAQMATGSLFQEIAEQRFTCSTIINGTKTPQSKEATLW
jgi:hypothetical protein